MTQRRTHVFIRMWAIAHIIHLSAATDGRLLAPWSLTVFVAALWLVWRPTSGRVLALLAGVQIIDYVAEMPLSPDHWFLLAIANLAILIAMLLRRSTSSSAIASSFGALRWILLVGYSFAALAKYNWSFLDPVASCATAIASAASYGLSDRLPPVWAGAALVLETSIPVLLALPWTRRHGVRIGMTFHFILSASPAFAVVDFTAALFAFFFLFLPDADVARIMGRLRWIGQRSAIVRDSRRYPPATIGVALIAFGLLGYLAPTGSRAVLYVGAELYLLVFLIVTLSVWRRAGGARQPLGRPAVAHALPLVLLVVWALNPYLGLRTAGVLTMFSNLRTEPGHANHLFMPTYPLTPWQSDLVLIQASSAPEVQRAVAYDVAVPFMQLRHLAIEDPGLEVVGTRGATDVHLGPDQPDGPIQPLTGWASRYLYFRPITTTDAPFCSIS